MNRLVARHGLYWLCCFGLLLLGGLFLRDGSAHPALLATIDHVNDGLGYSDPGSFAIGAKDIFLHGWVTPANYWVVNLWPPGFMFLEGWMLKLFGGQAPIVLIMLVLACVMLATMMTTQRGYLARFIRPGVAGVLPFLIFLFPMPRYFLFEPLGVVMSETFSVSFFVTATMLALLAVESGKLRIAAWAGLLFALAAYFRSQYEIFVVGLSGLGVVAVLVLAWKARKAGAANHTHYLLSLKVICVVVGVANVLMLPWRLHNYSVHNNFLWVQTSSLTVEVGLSRTEDLLAKNGSFVVNGGGNLACRLEPDYCGKFERPLFLKAFFNHPLEWIGIKMSIAPDYWQPPFKGGRVPSNLYELSDVIGNVIFLACLILSLPLLWVIRSYRHWATMAWLIGSLYGASFVIFTLVHFEIRYFFLLKIFSFSMAINLLAVAWSLRRRTSAAPFGALPA